MSWYSFCYVMFIWCSWLRCNSFSPFHTHYYYLLLFFFCSFLICVAYANSIFVSGYIDFESKSLIARIGVCCFCFCFFCCCLFISEYVCIWCVRHWWLAVKFQCDKYFDGHVAGLCNQWTSNYRGINSTAFECNRKKRAKIYPTTWINELNIGCMLCDCVTGIRG